MAISEHQRQHVLDALERGVSLRTACKEADLATHSRWYQEMERDPALADRYVRARQIGYSVLSEELIESLTDSETDPARLRIQTDTRKWMLAKMLPKLYGDRLDLQHTVKRDAEALTDAELAAVVAAAKKG